LERGYPRSRSHHAAKEGRLNAKGNARSGAADAAPDLLALPRPPGQLRRLVSQHPRVVDASLAALYLLVAVGLGTSSVYAPGSPAPLIIAGLAIGGVVAIVLRRRFAVASLLAASLLALLSTAGGTGAELIPVLVTLYAVGAYRSARAAWLSFAGAVVLAVASAYVITARAVDGTFAIEPPTAGDFASDWLNAAFVLGALALSATVLGTGASQRARYVAALVDRATQLASERDARAEIARAEERERIVREMHDVIAHSVSVMIALAEGAHAAAAKSPEQSQDAIARVAETGRGTLREVRRMLGIVRSDSAERAPQPGVAQLPALVEQLQQAGLPVQLTVVGTATDDPALGLTVYRIVQESLTNCLRHARGTTAVAVWVTWSSGEVELVIEDDAAAATATAEPGRGILGIRQRAALYDGVVEAGPRAGGGWRVAVRLRWAELR